MTPRHHDEPPRPKDQLISDMGIMADKSETYWWQDRLAELAQIGPDWDSYDALAPAGWAIRAAYSLLDILHGIEFHLARSGVMPTDIYPLPNGAIEAEWPNGDNILAIQARPNGKFHILRRIGVGPLAQYSETDDLNRAQAVRRVWEFVSLG